MMFTSTVATRASVKKNNRDPTFFSTNLYMNFITFSKVSSSTRVSGFRRRVYSPDDFFMARLFPREKPKLFLEANSLTSGNFSCIIATEPSTELLSTTQTSDSIFCKALNTLCRHCSRKC